MYQTIILWPLYVLFLFFLTCVLAKNLIDEHTKQLHCDPVINEYNITYECSCYFDGEKIESRNNQNMLFVDDSSFEIKCFNKNLPSYTTLERMVNLCNSKSPQGVYRFRLEYCLFSNTSFNKMLQILNIKPTSIIQLFIKYWPNIDDGFTAHEFENFTSVNAVEISNNHITNLPETIFRHMANLTRLDLTNNSIRTFRKEFGSLPVDDDDSIFNTLYQLTELFLDHNDLIYLPEKLFSDNGNLVKIGMTKSCNQAMSTLPPGLFANLTALQELRINENNFQKLPHDLLQNCHNLTALRLDHNSLRMLPASIFKDTSKLRYLNIGYNELDNLDNRIFQTLKNLVTLEMTSACSPHMSELPTALFANLTSLVRIKLDSNNLKKLPENLFRSCSELSTISIAKNALQNLPSLLFKDTIRLKELDLSDNQLESLAMPVFSSLKELHVLVMARNRLHSLYFGVFNKLTSLTRLDLSSNNLTHTYVNSNLFFYTTSLMSIDLSNNRLKLQRDDSALVKSLDLFLSPFSRCDKLEMLNLRNNSVDIFFFDWKHSATLKNLDLSFNKFRRLTSKDLIFSQQCDGSLIVDFSDNQIEGIFLNDFENATEFNHKALQRTPCERNTTLNRFETILNLRNNPIVCNCSIYDAVRYFRNKMLSSVNIILEHVYCYRPDSVKNTSLGSVDWFKLKCSLNSTYPEENSKCPNTCNCEYRPVDQSIVVNCSDAGMETFPNQLPNVTNTTIELLLENNNLKSLEGLAYLFSIARVAKLSLSFNKLENIDALIIPVGLKVLMLDNNKISFLDKTTIEQLNTSKTLTHLTLHNNQWSCNCESQLFVEFLQFQNKNRKLRIENYQNITCHSNERPIIYIQTEYLCDGLFIRTLPLISLFILALLIIAVLVLYHYFEHEIKIWMFAHKICLCLVTEKELDRNKKYDAFVSFSAKDELFVINYLMPLLEENPEHRIKLCIHHRDFVPGEYIPQQIINAVENSRRTIIVLSPNFLESVWTRMEFRLAHLKAIKERCARVVIIVLSEVDPQKLDDELKAYITMNTYVKWGDPWFWEKLRYALPHPDVYLKRR